ncbi:helix-turn-helix domain-containing protein [Kineococcus sp. R8]|uniref:helix-turn-helix domain-containing protein n=1 Tax=Kineococcus siccus TaxID=2696567 RepID=UPI001412D9E6|nr:helix-turn-helix domain-containing protein [Kineococcus siccus]
MLEDFTPATVVPSLGEMAGAHSPWNDFDVTGLHEVTDPAKVAILTDPRRVRFLRPFLARSATVSQVAVELDVTPNALLYRVRRMLQVGLLQVVEERARAGRAVRVYRSSHDGYRIPMAAMGFDDLRHRVDTYGRVIIDDLARAYTAALAQAPRHDRILARNRAGEVWGSDLVPTRTRSGHPVLFADAVVWLNRGQAEAVQRKFEEAITEALQRPDLQSSSGPRTPFLAMGVLLPMPD